MEPEEALSRPDDPLTDLVRQDLDRLSVAELEQRLRTLDSESQRTRQKIERAVNHRAIADELFKR